MEKGKADRGPGITARLWDSSLIQNSASESLQIGQRSEMKGSITMKKLMIAASAALCATVSFAELASANIIICGITKERWFLRDRVRLKSYPPQLHHSSPQRFFL